MKKVFSKVVKIVVDILTSLVFLLLIIVILAKLNMVFSSRNYFQIFGYSVFNVATGSMEPAIKQNDVILVKKTNDYELDDIVTYEGSKAYVTHRIISIDGDKYTTKGDANNAKDTSIDKSQIVGEVVKVFTGLGVWQKVLTTPSIIIMIFITLILFDFAFSYKGIKRKQNKKLVDRVGDISLVKAINEEKFPDITKEKIDKIIDKTKQVKNGEDVKFEKEEKEFLEYTIRMDLTELQNKINDKINKE